VAAEGIHMGGDEVRRPPRWADALLGTCLNAQEAETSSGDLLEAYRDSIYPLKGRWRADFWYVRQVVGYVLRAKGMGLRNWLLAGLALCVLTIAFSLFLYPALFDSWVAFVAVGFLFYGYAAACHTFPATPEDAVILRLGARYGIASGTLWIVGVLGLNLRLGVWGVFLVLLSYVLPLMAGAHGGVRLWRLRAGMLVGFWSGIISGLIVFLGFMAFGYLLAFIPGLPGAEIPQNHPYTAVEYQQLNVGDTLGGGLVQLFYGGAFSVIGATLGGLMGILLVRSGRSPEEPRRLVW